MSTQHSTQTASRATQSYFDMTQQQIVVNSPYYWQQTQGRHSNANADDADRQRIAQERERQARKERQKREADEQKRKADQLQRAKENRGGRRAA